MYKCSPVRNVIYAVLAFLHNDEVNAYYYSIMKYNCIHICVCVCNDARGVPMCALGGSFTHFEYLPTARTTLSHCLTKYHYNITLMLLTVIYLLAHESVYIIYLYVYTHVYLISDVPNLRRSCMYNIMRVSMVGKSFSQTN